MRVISPRRYEPARRVRAQMAYSTGQAKRDQKGLMQVIIKMPKRRRKGAQSRHISRLNGLVNGLFDPKQIRRYCEIISLIRFGFEDLFWGPYRVVPLIMDPWFKSGGFVAPLDF